MLETVGAQDCLYVLEREAGHIPEILVVDDDLEIRELITEILEKEGRPVYWWDAHFIITSALAFLHLCQFEPLAAMHLSLDFGHDTDSVAQTIGAFAGAVHGTEIFPRAFRAAVRHTIAAIPDRPHRSR